MILARKGITIVHRDDLKIDCEIVWIELKGLTLPIVIGVHLQQICQCVNS